jgi:hypothetical protein
MPKKRSRTERRERERALEKLTRDREALAHLEPGGTADRPIELVSASQVEPHARALGCLRCGHEPRVEEHAARVVAGRSLRLVTLSCSLCGAKRQVWVRLAPALPS